MCTGGALSGSSWGHMPQGQTRTDAWILTMSPRGGVWSEVWQGQRFTDKWGGLVPFPHTGVDGVGDGRDFSDGAVTEPESCDRKHRVRQSLEYLCAALEEKVDLFWVSCILLRW